MKKYTNSSVFIGPHAFAHFGLITSSLCFISHYPDNLLTNIAPAEQFNSAQTAQHTGLKSENITLWNTLLFVSLTVLSFVQCNRKWYQKRTVYDIRRHHILEYKSKSVWVQWIVEGTAVSGAMRGRVIITDYFSCGGRRRGGVPGEEEQKLYCFYSHTSPPPGAGGCNQKDGKTERQKDGKTELQERRSKNISTCWR